MRKKARQNSRLFCAAVMVVSLLLVWMLPLTVSADMGPKPSVTVTLKNLPAGECWGTLLSESQSTGPASAYTGEYEKDDYMNPELWPVFQAFEDADGYYFLQWMWRVDETGELSWTYYPPSPFKLLLYFPETDTFIVGNICERYAFDSSFTVDCSGVTLTHGGTAAVTVSEHYAYGREILGFAVRVLLTLVIEVGIALLFRYTEKKPLLVIVCTNLVTQLILNGLLQFVRYADGPRAFLISYVLCELLVTVIETVVYALTLNRVSGKKRRRAVAPVYAVVANLASLTIGVELSGFMPWAF